MHNYNNSYLILFSQIQMHQCAIECCKDSSNNMKSLEVCKENCSKEAIATQNHIHNEIDKWQVLISFCNLNECNY